MNIAVSVLTLITGAGVFLIACTMMSASLGALGDGKLKALFFKASTGKRGALACFGAGALATAVVQSSSATTVMVIGLVDVGIVTLAQAAAVIFGANVGTTITGQLVALGISGDGFPVSVALSSAAFAGAFIMAFSKSAKTKNIGRAVSGFGLLFVGLTLMSDAMSFIAELPKLRAFICSFRNPALLVLVGAIFTALVQSSSVMTSITITSVVSGLLSLDQGVYLTMGANIGTCITAILASAVSTRNAKRAALIHLLFNTGGVLLFGAIALVLSIFGTNFGDMLCRMFPHAPQLQLAMFHTVFNVATAAVALPLTNLFVKLAVKLIPSKKNSDKKSACRD